MLTATYSLVAITAEQDNARSILRRLQHYIQTTWNGLQSIDFAAIETSFNRLMQFDEYCHSRKIEMYLIPALRSASREAELLIAELDVLSTKASNALRSIGDQLAAAFDRSNIKVNEVYHSMELYCHHMLARLDREEGELLPLAKRVFSIEDWFSVAAQFLSDEAGATGRKRDVFQRQRATGKSGTTTVDVR